MQLALSILTLAVISQAPVPAGAKLLVFVEGKGVQIYRCTQNESSFEWTFQSPEAVLLDLETHLQVGTHGAGPTWIWKDGSSLKGKVTRTDPSPDPGSVPWLLLEGTPDPARPGTFSRPMQIRRFDTHGGKAPPTGCDRAHLNTILRVPYTATYSFTETR